MKKSGKLVAAVSGIIAGIGFSLALRNKIKKDKAEKQFPRLGSYCSVQGCDIHYLTEGQGRDIIFLHREDGDFYDFYLSPLWNGLKQNFRLTAFDRPGYGYSLKNNWKSYGFRNQGEIIDKAIKALGLKTPLVVAWGESAGVALAMLLEHEENYTGVILVDDKIPQKNPVSDKLVSVPLLGKAYLWTLLPVISENRAKTKVKNQGLKGELAEKHQSFENTPARLLNSSENKGYMDIQEIEKLKSYYSENNKPVTVINGKYDYSKSEDNGLLENLDIEDIFSNLQKISIPVNSDFYDLIQSAELLEEIKKQA